MVKHGLALVFFLLGNALIIAKKNDPPHPPPNKRACACQARLVSDICSFDRPIAKAKGIFLGMARVQATLVWVARILRAVWHTRERTIVSARSNPAIRPQQDTANLQPATRAKVA
jgi:hypothetical protein